MRERRLPLDYIITATTRSKRDREVEGRDYHFYTKEDFRQLIEQDELLEWAEVYGNYYGVPKGPVRESLSRGRDVMVKVDVQGAASIKRMAPEAVFIFLLPPSMEELTRRLSHRLTESPEALKRRLDTAPRELAELKMFDYFVVNEVGGLDRAVDRITSIISAEKSRVHSRQVEL
jgi:guanylate kinase